MSVRRVFLDTSVSPLRVYEYTCQIHIGFMGTFISPHMFHGYRCKSTEASSVHVSVHRASVFTGATLQRAHGYRC